MGFSNHLLNWYDSLPCIEAAACYPTAIRLSVKVPNLAWKNFDDEVMPRSNDEP